MVDPLHEAALILVALILLLVVLPLASWRRRRQAAPFRPAPPVWPQGLGHAFVIVCLAANGSFLWLDPRVPATVSPDGRTEVCMITHINDGWLGSDPSGIVLYRRRGAWTWKYCCTVDHGFGTTFTWNPDSSELVLDRGPDPQDPRPRFVMHGDGLVEGKPDLLPRRTTNRV